MGRGEEDGARALDERDDRDVPERDLVEQDQGRERRDRHRADAVGGDHDPLAVPAVDRDAREQPEDGVRKEPGEADEAGLGRRVRHREHEQRIRDRGHLRPDRREQPPGQQQHEVAVPP